jgi:adenylate kinase family enzyme
MLRISTGALLRARQHLLPELAQFMDQGLLVPDELICQILKERLAELDAREKGVLLDGFPRTRRQAELLDELPLPRAASCSTARTGSSRSASRGAAPTPSRAASTM